MVFAHEVNRLHERRGVGALTLPRPMGGVRARACGLRMRQTFVQPPLPGGWPAGASAPPPPCRPGSGLPCAPPRRSPRLTLSRQPLVTAVIGAETLCQRARRALRTPAAPGFHGLSRRPVPGKGDTSPSWTHKIRAGVQGSIFPSPPTSTGGLPPCPDTLHDRQGYASIGAFPTHRRRQRHPKGSNDPS